MEMESGGEVSDVMLYMPGRDAMGELDMMGDSLVLGGEKLADFSSSRLSSLSGNDFSLFSFSWTSWSILSSLVALSTACWTWF